MSWKEHILVVEDDAVVAELFEGLLPEHGLEVSVAPDAETALQLLRTESIDLIICDKNLPGMSGIDLLSRVRARQEELDVIIMTAYPDMASVLQALKQGAYDYIVKPFDSLDEVVQKVQRALEKRRMVRENSKLVNYLTVANEQIEEMNRDLEQQVNDRTAELEDANKRLENLTLTDDVTELYNQRYLYRRLAEEFERERRYQEGLSVIMMDIDFFKNVNDDHDHIFGSRVLKQVGAIILASVRTPDVVVRYGGDEFVVILPHTSIQHAMIIAERIREAIEGADVGTEEEGVYKLTSSFGVAALGKCDADSPKSLLRAADKALYAAKAGGRNRVLALIEDAPVSETA